ncbi:MAG: response regulator transcription factor [Cyanobacteria bacterium REEB67]|nr:response regulator transcription factor [Cyanobacteria bacterium REEB67]
MAKILLVEDNVDLATIVADSLRAERHVVESVVNGLDALEHLRMVPYELVLMDWDLPGLSGVEVVKRYRAAGGVSPVIMLTGKSSIDEKEYGFDVGADDYLPKPFETRELIVRVRALLRRQPTAGTNILQFGDLQLDPVKFKLTKGGEPVHLTPKDFALLEFFMRHPDELFSSEQIIARVYDLDSEANAESLRVAIRRIRKVIDTTDFASGSMIENVARVGYRLRLPLK